jgi:hypothetical protein
MIRFLSKTKLATVVQVLNADSTLKIRGINFWIFATGGLAVGLVVASFLLGTVDRNFVFNSDSMYLPMLFDDLFRNGENFSSWYLTPAPGFFPDMLLFFVSRYLLRNTLLNFTLFAVFQVGLAFLVALMMIRSFESAKARRLERSLVFGVFFLSAIAIFSFRGVVPYVHIFLPVYRFGAIFNILILSLFMFLILGSRRVLGGIGLSIICLLATATDIMFLPMAVVPAVLSIVLTGWISRRLLRGSVIKISFVLMASSLLGWLVKQLTVKNTMGHYIGFGYTPLTNQVRLIFSMIGEIFAHHPFSAAITLAFFLIVGFSLPRVIRSSRGYNRTADQTSDKELYILLFLLISPLITFAAVVVNGITTGAIHELRYISNFFWLPIFFSWLAFRPLGMQKRWLALSISVWIVLISLQLLYVPTSGLSKDYYPPLVQCVDNVVSEFSKEKKDPIKNGVSLYWEAKLITHFSRQGISAMQVIGDLSPFYWIVNESWYLDKKYDFAILAHNSPQAELGPTMPYLPSKDIIVSLNGQPKETRFCSTTDGRKFELMLYGSGGLRIRP